MHTNCQVLLLENVVGAEEVDDDLEEEMKEECSNYGEIAGIKIIVKKPDDEKTEDRVQIFISYTDPSSQFQCFFRFASQYNSW